MNHDIFFDCPQCNHTIKVSADLVGRPVQCPDCSHEFDVPMIHDGVNPRFRNQPRLVLVPSPLRVEGVHDDLDGLTIGFRSLLRRQKEQSKQLEFLEGNCNLIYKQLNMLGLQAPLDASSLPKVPSENHLLEESSPQKNWLGWSIALCLSSLGAAVVVLLFMIFTR